MEPGSLMVVEEEARAPEAPLDPVASLRALAAGREERARKRRATGDVIRVVLAEGDGRAPKRSWPAEGK